MQKVFKTNRAFLGPGVGDKDAPIVTLMNVPSAGGPHGSWDLNKGGLEYDELIDSLTTATKQISHVADYFCIACNTLHKTQPNIEEFLIEHKIHSKFISIVDTVKDYCIKNNVKSLAVMGSLMTTDVKDTSPYAPLSKNITLQSLPEKLRDKQQTALEMIKVKGPKDPEAQEFFQGVIDAVEADTVLLGCTEFPLMKPKTSKTLIDPTQLLADRLVALSWGYTDGTFPEKTASPS